MTTLIRNLYLAITCLMLTSISYGYGNSNCVTGFVSADALYWRVFESGLATCVPKKVTDTIDPTGKVTSKFTGQIKDPNFKWDTGFRFGFGYIYNGWDLATYWTHYQSKTHCFKNHSNELRWKINYNTVDVVTGYKFDLVNCFSLRPFGGIRLARIEQRLRSGGCHDVSSSSSSSSSSSCSSSSSSSSNSSSSHIIDFSTHEVHNKQKFSGIGPLIGLDGEWHVGCGFSLYANGAVSTLYGKYEISLFDSEDFVDAVNICKLRKNSEANLAAADAGFGIRWKSCLGVISKLVVQLGLEHHRYFDYNQIGSCCDLNFDGVNFSVGIEF